MGKITKIIFSSFLLLGFTPLLFANDNAPWGTANILNIEYKPEKVLYDLTSADKIDLSNLLDRAGYLYKLYESDVLDSSIVIVIHGGAIPFFAIDEFKKYENIMRRAQSLTVGTSIEFRMCRAAAKLLNYEPKDIHGFVTMVPMADAEIVRLQNDGYAYIR
jgi:intracellular sulfur oxidation DsrE/DsrF family protein